MTESQESSFADAPPPQQPKSRLGRTIGVVLGAVIILVALAGAIYGLVTNPDLTATVRDITIIILALSTTLIGLALVVLILQVQSLIALLRDEIKPILSSANQTARTVRGTTTFLSDSVVKPIISVASYASGIRQAAKLLAKNRSRTIPPD